MRLILFISLTTTTNMSNSKVRRVNRESQEEAEAEDLQDGVVSLYDSSRRDKVRVKKAAEAVNATTISSSSSKKRKADSDHQDLDHQQQPVVPPTKRPCHRLEAGDFSSTEISIALGSYAASSSSSSSSLNSDKNGPGPSGDAKQIEQDCEYNSSEDDHDDEDAQSAVEDNLSHLEVSSEADVLSLTGDSLPPTSEMSPSVSDVSGLSGHDLHASETGQQDYNNNDPDPSSALSSEATIYYGDSSGEELTPEVAVPRMDPATPVSSNRRSNARRHLNFMPLSRAAAAASDPQVVPGSIWDAED